MTQSRPRSSVATRNAGRAGIGLALAATTVAAMAVPAGAATQPARATTTSTVTAGATALALPRVKVPSALPTVAPAMTYRVQAGDTVSHIALRTGASVSAIVQANGLDSRAFIRVGQMLRIPVPGSAAPVAAPAPSGTAARTHTVAAGETVSGLAARYRSSVSAITSANGLNSRALIRIGQRLTIPAGGSAAAPSAPAPAAPAPSAPQAGGSHTVASGETVSGLAARYGTSVSAIVSANRLNSRALIFVGQRLTIPGAGSGTGAAPAPTSPSAGPLVPDSFLGRTYPQQVVAAANANKATLNAMSVPSRAEMQSIVAATARDMGVDPALALAIAQAESGFDARAVSPANALGTMQVIPSSGEWASNLVGRRLNLLNPRDNVVAGVAILRQLVRTAPNQDTAIAGYYQGLAGVLRDGMYADTRTYVAKIKTNMAQYR